jgi:hypothetical protein
MRCEVESIAFVRSLLRRRRLKYSTPATFNDPFEARPHIKLPDATLDEQRAIVKRFLAGARALVGDTPESLPTLAQLAETGDLEVLRAKFEDAVRTVLGHTPLVACLAGTRRSILMWAHYADHHRGACVHLSGRIQPLRSAWPVTYSDEYPTLTVPWLEMEAMEFTRLCVLTKATQWRYEREYRLIGPQPGQPSEVSFNGEIGTLPMGSVTGMTIGARMEEAAAAELVRCAIDRHIPVWRARLHDRNYRLTFDRLDKPPRPQRR